MPSHFLYFHTFFMLRFLIDIFWFPFFPNSKKNKFWLVLKFVFKDFVAYFYSRPTFLKVFLFPFLVIHLICKKTKYEIFGCFWQIVLWFFLFVIWFVWYWLYKYDYNVQFFATQTCLSNNLTLEICYQWWKLINYPFIGDKTYKAIKGGKVENNWEIWKKSEEKQQVNQKNNR